MQKEKITKYKLKKLLCILMILCWSCIIQGCGNDTKKSTITEVEISEPIKSASLSTVNAEIIQEEANALRTKTYIGIDDFEYITVSNKAYFKVHSYKNVEGVFQYLGYIEWLNSSLSKAKIKQEYSEVTHIRVELKMANGQMQTLDTVNDSKNVFLVNGEDYNYQIGTIFSADGKVDLERNTRFFTEEYLSLIDYKAVALSQDYAVTWFAYFYDGTEYKYLGTSGWLGTGYFSIDSIKEKYPDATHFRFAVRGIKEDFHLTDSDELANEVKNSGVSLFKESYVPEYELGEIFGKYENAGQNNDGSITAINDTMVYNEYIDLNEVTAISLEEGFQLAYYVFNDKKEYLGYNRWFGSQINMATSDVTEQFDKAKYIKLAIRTKTGEEIQEQKNIVSFYNEPDQITSYAYYQDLDEKYGRLTCDEITELKKIQDGSFYNDMILCMNANQTGFLYSIDKRDEIATVKLDGNLKVHCNSVCFGNEKFDETDDFPLLYCNVYNSYAAEEDRKEGICGVYRLIKQKDGNYIGELIQVIEIGFTEELTLWKSKENNEDIRPYGNFAVDLDHNKLYTFVPRDAEEVTRFFSFELPDFNEGIVNTEYQVKTVTLSKDDILTQFDERYIHYPQGTAYNNGKLYILEGMENRRSLTKLSILDLSAEKMFATIDLDDMGITAEPEMITVDRGSIFFTDIDGILYKINLLNVY